MSDVQHENRVLLPPAGLQIRESRYQLEISFRWFTPQGGRLLGGLTLVWTLLLIAGFLFLPEDYEFIWMFFGLAEIGFVYYTTALFINRTTVTLTQENIHVIHGPIPVKESKTYPRESVQRIYSQVRSGQSAADVFISTPTDGEICLLERLENADEAEFIVNELENRLGV